MEIDDADDFFMDEVYHLRTRKGTWILKLVRFPGESLPVPYLFFDTDLYNILIRGLGLSEWK